MAVYAIGDVQGCFDELQALLDRLAFNAVHDRLWFTGDLVNRGPMSLETLRFIKGLGDAALSVLGNHDLHLLAAAYGHTLKNDDHTLDAVLDAPDRDELIDWLRHRPLLHHDADLDFTLVHAGLPPQWDLALAQRCANEVETMLRSDGIADLLTNMYGNNPKQWTDELEGYNRLRFIINCFTRMRYCDPAGRLDLKSIVNTASPASTRSTLPACGAENLPHCESTRSRNASTSRVLDRKHRKVIDFRCTHLQRYSMRAQRV
jgi:bis(5'-nucleosyl)-tetraphosphatase (symmetrical)